MKKIDLEKVMELLSYVLKCPVCSYRYNLERTKVIDTRQEAETAHLLVHSDCAQCKSSVVFGIAVNGPDIFTVGVITDLTSSDIKKFADKKPVTAGEVLDLHHFLAKFDGDFVKALR